MSFLFPFHNTFLRLKLDKCWWHRLLKVLYVAFIVICPLFIWISLNRSEMEALSYCVQYLRKTGNVDCSVYQVHHLFNFGIGMGTMIIGSYLLQIIYRIALYVAFGPSLPA